MNLLEIKNLTLEFPSRIGGSIRILDDLSFHIREGEILGLIGNSGSGKTLTSLAITGLLPPNAKIVSGDILYNNRSLLQMPSRRRREFLGNEIGMIFQDPYSALDPLVKIESALEEVLKIKGVSKSTWSKIILDILFEVGLDKLVLDKLPHELSGGQRQRVLIALALILSPKLLIADEPTSALDSVTTVQILELLKKLAVERKISLLFISHDIKSVRMLCDRILVMRKGAIIESDVTSDILYQPKTSYLADLLTKSTLNPKLLGLSFCSVDYDSSPVMSVRNLSSGYKKLLSSGKKTISDISFDVFPSEVISLIGSSGCGKTTLVKAITGLLKGTQGEITYKSSKPRVVFQDPISSLNPMHTIYFHLREPLLASKRRLTKEEERKLITDTITSVGLEEKHLLRYPHELSGGQRQRVSIASCLITDPDIIIADEPFSSLDASTGGGIMKLLSEINKKRKTSIIVITHNLSIAKSISKRLIVMDNGKIAEHGLTSELISNPKSQALIKLLEADRKLGL